MSETADYGAIVDSIANIIAKTRQPLTETQRVAMAGAVAIYLDQANRRPDPAPVGVSIADLDAAFETEIKRVSTLEYNSNEICRHFYGELRKRLNQHPDAVVGEDEERCESGDPECGPVEFHDVEGVPLCRVCWDGLIADSSQHDGTLTNTDKGSAG